MFTALLEKVVRHEDLTAAEAAASLPLRPALWPLLVLAVVNQELLKRKAYASETLLLLLCRLTLALQLGMGLLFTLMLWERF